MILSKRFFRIIAIVLFGILFLYFAATLFDSALCNIISVLGAYTAAGILLFSYLKSDRKVKVSITFLLYSIACFSWGIADTIWAIISFSGGNPENSSVLWVIYALTNCLLLAAMVLYAVCQFRKWDLVQSAIDVTISGFLTVVLFWIIFLNKNTTILNNLLVLDFTSILSIITDILICIGIFSWFISVRSGKIPAFIRIISFGLVLFALTDVTYYYMVLTDLYYPNSLIDYIYLFSLAVIAFGALWKTYKDSSVFELNVVTNIGKRIRWVYLLLYPLVMIIISYTGIVKVRLTIDDYASLFIPVLVYWALCKYVQVSIEKESVLKRNNELLEQRVAEQIKELSFLANQDILTRLYNRRYFMSCLDGTLKNKGSNDLTALIMIDLDRFKTINDSMGHDVGDMVLIDISNRLVQWNNNNAVIARLGGDEYAILLSGKYSKNDIEGYCNQIILACRRPIKIEGSLINITISIGISLTISEKCSGRELMQNAEIAMYRAKSQGYNKFLFYDLLMSDDFRKLVEIEVLLKQTDVEKDFEMFYQPQFQLPELKLIGAEGLIRWKNAEHGYIPPSLFIPIAEQTGHIHKIGKWVMQEVMKQAVVWNDHYSIPLKIGFNLSPKQLKDEGFINLFQELISENSVNPNWVDIEITESVMMNNEDDFVDKLSALRDMGFSVSIDDFGSGYSALGYLNKYQFDRVKIDKSLVDNISSHSLNGSNVVRAAVDMAHASGIKTIAEGIERQEQLDVLTKLGCDQIQGYLIGRPVPADIFEQRYLKQIADYLKFDTK